jgi:hypothetical protein
MHQKVTPGFDLHRLRRGYVIDGDGVIVVEDKDGAPHVEEALMLMMAAIFLKLIHRNDGMPPLEKEKESDSATPPKTQRNVGLSLWRRRTTF